MRVEIRRMLTGRGFWAGVFLAMLGIAFGAEYPELSEPLPPGCFLELVKGAMDSKTALFLFPAAAALPWSDSFLGEWKGGFLKSSLPRIGRRIYVEGKILAVAFGGFLAWILAGVLMAFLYFVIFFPMEQRGALPEGLIGELAALILRCGILGGIISSLGGIFGTVTGSVYLAYGLPFVSYYFCVILHERYFEDALWLYPPQWILGTADWGPEKAGLYFFLLLFLAVVIGIHGGVLYGRLEEL